MKVVVAIDSFKGSVSSIVGSNAIASGVLEACPLVEVAVVPLADGGEGTVEAITEAKNGEIVNLSVTGPLEEKVDSYYGVINEGKTAVIEVATACGLPLVPLDMRNPKITTTYGVGELILDAMNRGCRDFVIGLGGSATNDGGVGMLQALGFKFLDNKVQDVGFGGGSLSRIDKVEVGDVDSRLEECTFRVACDVNNPLFGMNGATYIYGPQKGASGKMLEELDAGLKHFAEVVERDLGIDIYSSPGSGAAGGLGAAFIGFLGGKLQSGIELILKTIEMEKHLEGAEYVITGEGKLDGQTSMGKAPMGVAQMAADKGIPVIALAGAIGDGVEKLNELGITSYFSIMNKPMSLDEAMDSENTISNLRENARQLFSLIKAVERKRMAIR